MDIQIMDIGYKQKWCFNLQPFHFTSGTTYVRVRILLGKIYPGYSFPGGTFFMVHWSFVYSTLVNVSTKTLRLGQNVCIHTFARIILSITCNQSTV